MILRLNIFEELIPFSCCDFLFTSTRVFKNVNTRINKDERNFHIFVKMFMFFKNLLINMCSKTSFFCLKNYTWTGIFNIWNLMISTFMSKGMYEEKNFFLLVTTSTYIFFPFAFFDVFFSMTPKRNFNYNSLPNFISKDSFIPIH